MSEYDLNKVYNQYVDDVLSGEVLACQNIIQTCK